MQFGDLGRSIPELPQYRIRMLALVRCRLQPFGLREGAHVDRLADDVEAAELRMVDRAADAEVLNLRVGEDLVDRVDRAAGHAGLVEFVDPELARLRPHDVVEV